MSFPCPCDTLVHLHLLLLFYFYLHKSHPPFLFDILLSSCFPFGKIKFQFCCTFGTTHNIVYFLSDILQFLYYHVYAFVLQPHKFWFEIFIETQKLPKSTGMPKYYSIFETININQVLFFQFFNAYIPLKESNFYVLRPIYKLRRFRFYK